LKSLSDETAAHLAANAADLALIIDDRGIIRDAAFSGEDIADQDPDEWIGRAWIDTVTVESRPKIETLIGEAAQRDNKRWRQVTHPLEDGPDLPVRYFTVESGRPGWVLAIGRDLRASARMQQRLLDAQHAIEREYSRLRSAETRFRLLFQAASEGVLIVNAGTMRVTHANPAAAKLFGLPAQKIENRGLDPLFRGEDAARVRDMLSVLRGGGGGDSVRATAAESGRRIEVEASVYRQDNETYYLLRVAPEDADAAAAQGGGWLLTAAEALPDGFVVADDSLRILAANDAFLEMAQLSSANEIEGDSLESYLGAGGVDLNVLMANLRKHGVARNFATTVNSRHGLSEDVEISAVSAERAGETVYGFSIRNVGRRLAAAGRAAEDALPRSVDQLTELVGRVSLKEIVRESTDLIERYCIEAALELTKDNRASAAEILGLSRQSLYAKMRRHNIGDLPPSIGK